MQLSRRALFKGQLANTHSADTRPPWAQPESTFLDLCTRCDKCVNACENSIIVRGDGGYPRVDFMAGECTFCGDCTTACQDGALLKESNTTSPQATPPWNLIATVDDTCLSASGITCRVCGDRCDVRAIQFKLALGGVADPIIDISTCTGCGACVAPCPVGAINIEPSNDEYADNQKAEEACL